LEDMLSRTGDTLTEDIGVLHRNDRIVITVNYKGRRLDFAKPRVAVESADRAELASKGVLRSDGIVCRVGELLVDESLTVGGGDESLAAGDGKGGAGGLGGRHAWLGISLARSSGFPGIE